MPGGFAIDWWQVLVNLGHVAGAYALSLPLAWDREKASVSVGLRTFPIVAVASCGFVLTGASIAGGDQQALARIIQGLMTGIGFVGGGAILKKGRTVEGAATAASIWNTGAIGAAAALGRYELAIVLSVVNFLTFRLLTPLKKSIGERGGDSSPPTDGSRP